MISMYEVHLDLKLIKSLDHIIQMYTISGSVTHKRLYQKLQKSLLYKYENREVLLSLASFISRVSCSRLSQNRLANNYLLPMPRWNRSNNPTKRLRLLRSDHVSVAGMTLKLAEDDRMYRI